MILPRPLKADVVYVLDIYGAGEEPIPGISGQTLVEKFMGGSSFRSLGQW